MGLLKRPSNRSRAEIQRTAQRAIETHGGPALARVWYKFDCGACGERCVAPDPNVLPSEAACHTCGAMTRIIGAGYALEIRASRFVDWDRPSSRVLGIRPRYESDRGDA
jgi:hypothetical protein